MASKNPACPKCKTNAQVKKNGTSSRGKQRYRCRKCSKSFQLNNSASVIMKTSDTIDNWVQSDKNLSNAASDKGISPYHLKKMITGKYKSMLAEAEQETARLKGVVLREENMINEARRQIEALPDSSYGDSEKIKYRVKPNIERLNASKSELEKAECKLKALEKLKRLTEPEKIKELKEVAPMLGSKLEKNPSVTINFSEFKKILRKEVKS